jgi:hypothetical protein
VAHHSTGSKLLPDVAAPAGIVHEDVQAAHAVLVPGGADKVNCWFGAESPR